MLRAISLCFAIGIATAPVVAETPQPRRATAPMTNTDFRYQPINFADVPGWPVDDHAAAFSAFLNSCRRLVSSAARQPAKTDTPAKFSAPSQTARSLQRICEAALASEPTIKSAALARRFFEQHFTPHRLVHAGPAGLLTAYYEPLIDGSRVRSAAFSAPLYRRPADLVNLVDEQRRGAVGEQLTHGRKSAAGVIPYATRAEIDRGALAGQSLELLYLADPVDVFFLQIQGSGRIRLPDGQLIRVTYDGKNGHPYTSIGRHLIDTGVIDAARMSLQSLAAWLKADRKRGEAVMWQNKSYVFFRELTGAQASSPLGVLDVPLTKGRSLAIDAGHHALGLPIYVTAPALTHAGNPAGFHHLMIAQDVGSAIRGPERGDLFFGSGDDASRIAGVTKHPGSFIVLLPREQAPAALRPRQSDHTGQMSVGQTSGGQTAGGQPAGGQTTGALPSAAPVRTPKQP